MLIHIIKWPWHLMGTKIQDSPRHFAPLERITSLRTSSLQTSPALGGSDMRDTPYSSEKRLFRPSMQAPRDKYGLYRLGSMLYLPWVKDKPQKGIKEAAIFNDCYRKWRICLSLVDCGVYQTYCTHISFWGMTMWTLFKMSTVLLPMLLCRLLSDLSKHSLTLINW